MNKSSQPLSSDHDESSREKMSLRCQVADEESNFDAFGSHASRVGVCPPAKVLQPQFLLQILEYQQQHHARSQQQQQQFTTTTHSYQPRPYQTLSSDLHTNFRQLTILATRSERSQCQDHEPNSPEGHAIEDEKWQRCDSCHGL